MRSLVLPLLLAVAAPLAAAPKNVPPAKVASVEKKADPHGDPELQSLRRQLASAVLLSELKLTSEQKVAMRQVLAEARKLRDEKTSDPALASFRAERKTALRAAIDEVHSKGALSEKTRESMKDVARDARDDGDDFRDKAKALRESMMGILTPAQIEHMKELREARMEKAGKGDRKGAGKAGKQGLLRLVLSDQFAAELDR